MMSRRPLRTNAADAVMESSSHWTRGGTRLAAGGGVRRGGSGGAGQVEQVGAFGVVELQRPGDRV